MRPLFIVRAEPGATQTVRRAKAMGMDARSVPLFDIGPLDWTPPDPSDFDAILLTSANAVRHGGGGLDRLKNLPVHAVGQATARAAREVGFTVHSVGEGGLTDLKLPPGRLLHLAGRHHLPAGVAQTVCVYEARTIDRPAGLEEVRDCVVAVHSPAAGRRLAELVGARSRIVVAAISQAAAAACGAGWERVEAADKPNDDALLALAAGLCESLPQ